MELDDELCLCFHVTKRKVINYLRIERPRSPSQLADCQGAGTGCGWCRPFLKRLWEASTVGGETPSLPHADEYGTSRAGYINDGKGSATKVELTHFGRAHCCLMRNSFAGWKRRW